MIDANVFLSYLFPSDKLEAAKKIFRSADDPVTILDVLEEVVYVGLSLNHGSKGFKLKGEIMKRGFSEIDRQYDPASRAAATLLLHRAARPHTHLRCPFRPHPAFSIE